MRISTYKSFKEDKTLGGKSSLYLPVWFVVVIVVALHRLIASNEGLCFCKLDGGRKFQRRQVGGNLLHVSKSTYTRECK